MTKFVILYKENSAVIPAARALQMETMLKSAPQCWIDPDRLKVLERIGEGAFSCVHAAHFEGRRVAVKMLSEFDNTHTSKVNEARILLECTRLQMTRVCEFIGYTVIYGQFCIVTKLYPGGDLKRELSRHEAGVQTADVLRYAEDVAAALQQVHAAGVVVGDLKPANLLLDDDGRLVIADLGLAVQVDERTGYATVRKFGGTPGFMAPETIAGFGVKKIDNKADMYALGGVLFQLITGQHPPDLLRTAWIESRWTNVSSEMLDAMARSRVSHDLIDLIDRCLSCEPEDRPDAETALKEIRRQQVETGKCRTEPGAPKTPPR